MLFWSCAYSVMWNDSVAGGISSCLYPNCDQKTVNGAGTATTAANTTATQSCGREAYGSCTTGQKEHSARWILRVPATKLTLTCQINSISKERGRRDEEEGGGGGGSSFLECHLMVTKTARRETVTRCWGQIWDGAGRRLKSTCLSLLSPSWAVDTVCPYMHHTNTQTHTNTHRQTDMHPLAATLPPHCFERYVNETVAVSWHNINYPIKIEWVINCPSLPVLITLAEKGHFRGAKKKKKKKEKRGEERKKDRMKRYQTKT